jgi:hypothetical protein
MLFFNICLMKFIISLLCAITVFSIVSTSHAYYRAIRDPRLLPPERLMGADVMKKNMHDWPSWIGRDENNEEHSDWPSWIGR